MKLWLISQTVNNNYDTYDSAVVAAETEQDARETYPDKNIVWDGSNWMFTLSNGDVVRQSSNDWTTPDNVIVKFLADGYDGSAGTVCASFNAG